MKYSGEDIYRMQGRHNSDKWFNCMWFNWQNSVQFKKKGEGASVQACMSGKSI